MVAVEIPQWSPLQIDVWSDHKLSVSYTLLYKRGRCFNIAQVSAW